MLSQTLINTLRQWHLLVLLFLLTLIPALPPALAFFSTLTSEVHGSLAPVQMMPGFNYTVFSDFMHDHGGAVWPLIRAGWWTAVLSLLISVWAKGGVLYSFTNGFSAVTFWQAGTHYFSRNLRLLAVTGLFVLLWGLSLLLVGTLIVLLLDGTLDVSYTERGYVALGAVVGLIFGLILVRILCTSQYASVLMYQHDVTAAMHAFAQSWRFIRLHRLATFGRYLLLLLIGTVLLGVYLLVESAFNAGNWLLIGILFLLQQAFVFSRVTLTVWSLRLAFTNAQTLPQPVARSVAKPNVTPSQSTSETTPRQTDSATSDDITLAV
ncbi:hypothetical protein [Fibrella forsythiae]|uniref:DUF975 family protein n=1 Tax=Fibrella forsythiae TaxID=2817061 RepID=A0ABS3JNJ2_9BACT|nr:hypothetical protein [Fibrella forsythiae]MBO0951594.1 hypothetical protein [Fibrella forsythiae]